MIWLIRILQQQLARSHQTVLFYYLFQFSISQFLTSNNSRKQSLFFAYNYINNNNNKVQRSVTRVMFTPPDLMVLQISLTKNINLEASGHKSVSSLDF